MTTLQKHLERLRQYLSLSKDPVKIKKHLGYGTDGAVWSTDRVTAIKVFEREIGYFNERDAYLRLAEYDVIESINGFWIPKMVGYSDEFMVVEMDLMQDPPYIIDFAKVRIDRPPDFSPETLEDNEKKGRELFEENWPAVQSLLNALESYQIYYLDPQPHNIVFPTEGGPAEPGHPLRGSGPHTI